MGAPVFVFVPAQVIVVFAVLTSGGEFADKYVVLFFLASARTSSCPQPARVLFANPASFIEIQFRLRDINGFRLPFSHLRRYRGNRCQKHSTPTHLLEHSSPQSCLNGVQSPAENRT
jgi:hypothetical protein